MADEKICTYMGSNYSDGQEVCEADKCMMCVNGEWVDEGIA